MPTSEVIPSHLPNDKANRDLLRRYATRRFPPNDCTPINPSPGCNHCHQELSVKSWNRLAHETPVKEVSAHDRKYYCDCLLSTWISLRLAPPLQTKSPSSKVIHWHKFPLQLSTDGRCMFRPLQRCNSRQIMAVSAGPSDARVQDAPTNLARERSKSTSSTTALH